MIGTRIAQCGVGVNTIHEYVMVWQRDFRERIGLNWT